MQKSLKLQQNTGLTTSKIIASKRCGNSVVFLSETSAGFILSVGEVNGFNLRIIAKKSLTLVEAQSALVTIFATQEAGAENANTEAILIENAEPVAKDLPELVDIQAFVSPYFSSKDIFLTSQKTRAPTL